MATHSVSQTKNFMKRAVAEILEPRPSKTQIEEIWSFFDSRCAYCRCLVVRGRAHLDHVVRDSGNHVGNFVLACAECNGNEKREGHWRGFLKKKASEKNYESRLHRILEWRRRHPRPRRHKHSQKVTAVLNRLDLVRESFETECNNLKALLGRR